MKRQRGNRDVSWVKRGFFRGEIPTNQAHGSGDGFSGFHKSVKSVGGLIQVVLDVNVPPIPVKQNPVDWSGNYSAASLPDVNHLPVLSYADPIDTSSKVHGRGHFVATAAFILYGLFTTGFTAPHSVAGQPVPVSMSYEIRYGASAVKFLYRAQGTLQFSTPPFGELGDIAGVTTTRTPYGMLGNDATNNELCLFIQNNDLNNGNIGGWLRIVILGLEVC